MNDEELAHYSAALDEIWRLRLLLAVYARGTEADADYKTFPKSRRDEASERINGSRAAARGQSGQALANIARHIVWSARTAAEMPQTFTRTQWETRNNK